MSESKSKLVPIICMGHSKPVPYIKFSHDTEDGYFLLSACLDKKPMIREGITGDWIGSFCGHKGAVWCANLNKEATLAVTASADYSMGLWDAVRGTNLGFFKAKHILKTAVFSADGKSMLSGGKEKKIRIIDVETKTEKIIENCHNDTINFLFCPESSPNTVISSADEKNVKIWDTRTWECVKTLETSEPMTCLHLSRNESVLSGSADKELYFWDANTFDLIRNVHTDRRTRCIATCDTTKRYVTGSMDDLYAKVYNFNNDEELMVNVGHHGPVLSLDFTPNGDAYASGSQDGTIRIWDHWRSKKTTETTETAATE